jgi:hypothetical protein
MASQSKGAWWVAHPNVAPSDVRLGKSGAFCRRKLPPKRSLDGAPSCVK